jgi:hypothetical protein
MSLLFFVVMPVKTGIQNETLPSGRASYRQLARNDGAFIALLPDP